MTTDNRTTELREKLDERGVESWDMQTRGIWFGIKGDNHKYEAHEQRNGLILIEASDLTPEQAIAATVGSELNPDGLPVGLMLSKDGMLLNWCGENYVKQGAFGSGTLTAEHVREAIERHVKFYEGGDYDEQAIADELNARVERTCKFVSSKGSDYPPVCSA